jgi:hypothetical protein
VWLQLAISAMFSSLEIKGSEEVDLTIGVMNPVRAGAGAGAGNRPIIFGVSKGYFIKDQNSYNF